MDDYPAIEDSQYQLSLSTLRIKDNCLVKYGEGESPIASTHLQDITSLEIVSSTDWSAVVFSLFLIGAGGVTYLVARNSWIQWGLPGVLLCIALLLFSGCRGLCKLVVRTKFGQIHYRIFEDQSEAVAFLVTVKKLQEQLEHKGNSASS